MTRKTTRDYWNRSYKDIEPHTVHKSHLIRSWIEAYVPRAPKNRDKSCIEIGCYPGRFLSIFGELGYRLYGIDIAEKLPRLPKWLEDNGYKVGRFWQEDFADFNPRRQFDVIASFGFIEHFTNFDTILNKHVSLLAQGGYLVLEVPNFIGGFQYWLHAHLDRRNYEHHHIFAMDIANWLDLLQKSDLDIIYQGYFGGFDFWAGRPGSVFERVALRALGALKKPMKFILPPDVKAYSPCAGIIARKS